MNQQNAIPPVIPTAEDVTERIPHAIGAIEALLRQPLRLSFQLRQPGAGRLICQMLLIIVACSLVYGVVTGTFSGGMQLWAAPIKIAGGLLISAAICLPSLYVFRAGGVDFFSVNRFRGLDGSFASCLLGGRHEFWRAFPEARIFPHRSQVAGGGQCLDHHFPVGGIANDDRIAADRRQIRRLFSC